MNKENAKDYLPLVQALSEGKTLQRKTSSDSEWADITECAFTFDIECYRIKPEPRRIWVNEYESDGYFYSTKQEANEKAASNCRRIAVEYVEVIK